MKKVLSIAVLLLVVTTTVSAQWEIKTIEADELKGRKGGNVYIYTNSDMGSIVIWDWKDYQFRLTSDHAMFNTTVLNGRVGIFAIVGIYDDVNQLKDKLKIWLDLEDNTSHRFISTPKGLMQVGQKPKIKKIFKALLSQSGYVRIVTERYDTTDFDLKIPPYIE